MSRMIFDCAARLVSEFAEVNFEGVRRRAQHVNVGAGAKDPRLQTGHHDGTNFRMFEAQALNGVGEFDVHAEVVRIELQLVTFGESLILLPFPRKLRTLPPNLQFPSFSFSLAS